MPDYPSWNFLPDLSPRSVYPLSSPDLPGLSHSPGPFTPYGQGRSYGDVCLTDRGTLLLTRDLDQILEFDPHSGRLRCQAGVTLSAILDLIVPRGWFLPTTPGTRYITIGGAIANDVHGKNHHAAGTFGHHVIAFELLRSDQERLVCSPDEHRDFFHATIGGLGLTGLITWAEIQLIPIHNAFMDVESHRFQNLDEYWALNADAEARFPYTVSWIDCLASGESLGRGILMAGKHAAPREDLPTHRELSAFVPLTPPLSLINRFSLKAFNALYFRKPTHPDGTLSHYAPFFYPLDAIKDWNRIYGPRGFYQYQCVIPPSEAKEGIKALLQTIHRHKEGSFLAVLKNFGPKPSLGPLSFPRPGTTLALDFPNRGPKTLDLFHRLDQIVLDAGGVLYPAKDARMPPELFQSMYPQWQDFSSVIDPHFSSHFWERVTP